VQALFDLLYPPLCLHCEELLHPEERTLCSDCLGRMEPVVAKERCPRCFSEPPRAKEPFCSRCLATEGRLEAVAAPFDHIGPAATLVRRLKYGNRPDLAPGMAGYMAAQLFELGWSKCHLIVPVPTSRLRLFRRGYNQSALLAEELGALLSLPVKNLLKKSSGRYRQAGRLRRQRRDLDEAAFSLRDFDAVQKKRILLIDDVAATGATLECCASLLSRAGADRLFALTFTRAI